MHIALVVTTPTLLDDIALATLTAAKLVLKSASAAGLDLESSPEVLASIEEMADRTAREHLDQMAATLLGASGSRTGEVLSLKKEQGRWRLTGEGETSDRVANLSELSERAAHLLGEIMLFLGRSRAAVAGDSWREAHENLAQVLAMMALAKVLFSLVEGEGGPSAVKSLTDKLTGPA